MKLLAGLVASVAVFGSIQLLHDGNDRSAAADTASSSNYRLTANGDEAACAIHRGAEVSDGLSLLTVAPTCRRLLPGIEHAKFWREEADGTIAFSENGIDPIVAFSNADGDGYESYAPVTPLLALATEGDSKPGD